MKRLIRHAFDLQVYPSDVMGPSIPGPVVLIVDCPTQSHAAELLSVKSLESFYSCSGGDQADGKKSVHCIIHLSPSSVTSSPTYQSWMKNFHTAQHILAGHQRFGLSSSFSSFFSSRETVLF